MWGPPDVARWPAGALAIHLLHPMLFPDAAMTRARRAKPSRRGRDTSDA